MSDETLETEIQIRDLLGFELNPGDIVFVPSDRGRLGLGIYQSDFDNGNGWKARVLCRKYGFALKSLTAKNLVTDNVLIYCGAQAGFGAATLIKIHSDELPADINQDTLGEILALKSLIGPLVAAKKLTLKQEVKSAENDHIVNDDDYVLNDAILINLALSMGAPKIRRLK